MENTELVQYEEVQGKDWVIFYGMDRYYITTAVKEAILDGAKHGLNVIVVDGVVWSDKFSRILPVEMVKESDYLKAGYRRSTKEPGKWYIPGSNPIVYR